MLSSVQPASHFLTKATDCEPCILNVSSSLYSERMHLCELVVLHLYLYIHMFSASLLDNGTLWLKAQIPLVTSFHVCSFLVFNAMVRELKLGCGGRGDTSGKLRFVAENSKGTKYLGKELTCSSRGEQRSRVPDALV